MIRFAKKKRASRLVGTPFVVAYSKDVLFRRYADGTGAFLALANLELNRLTFLKVRVALGLNLGMMDEEVFAAIIGDDKSKTLFAVKPLYFTCTHLCSFGRKGHKHTISLTLFC